jgi:3-phenylpropionate/trans-cinnamate dioxygenase ferredoxin component
MALVTVARLSDLVPRKGKCVQANGKRLALFLVDGTCYAIDDSCTHRTTPLSDGQCWGTEVICPLHGARFDLATGAAKSPPAKTGVKSYPVQIEGDEVKVEV